MDNFPSVLSLGLGKLDFSLQEDSLLLGVEAYKCSLLWYPGRTAVKFVVGWGPDAILFFSQESLQVNFAQG